MEEENTLPSSPLTPTPLGNTAADSTGPVGYRVKDGGIHGWLVVLGSHICCVMAFGVIHMIGPLFVAVQEDFQVSSSRVSLMISLVLFLGGILGPFANICVKKLGLRLTVVIGTVLSSGGYFFSAFASSVEFLYFSYAILLGLGYGLIGPPAIGIIPLYIKKRYSLANALAMCGPGLAGFVFPPIIQALIDRYGWRGAVITLSAVNAHLLIAAALFRAPFSTKSPNTESPSGETRNGEHLGRPRRGLWWKFSSMCDFSIFIQYPSFVVTCVATALGLGLGYYGMPAHLFARAKVANIGTHEQVPWFASAFGIGTILGRLSVPLVFCRRFRYITSARMYGSSLVLTGVTHLFSPICSTADTYMAYALTVGFFCGMIVTLPNQVIRDIVGDTKMIAACGLVLPLDALAGLVGPPCAGFIYDVTGDYNNSFYFYAAFSLLGGLVMLICEPITSRRQTRNYETQTKEVELSVIAVDVVDKTAKAAVCTS